MQTIYGIFGETLQVRDLVRYLEYGS